MSQQPFHITFRKLYDPNIYRAKVEITSKTDHVVRFLITAGTKQIKMEKFLFRKGNQWQVIDFNFSFHSSQANDKLMIDIQNAIDAELGKSY